MVDGKKLNHSNHWVKIGGHNYVVKEKLSNPIYHQPPPSKMTKEKPTYMDPTILEDIISMIKIWMGSVLYYRNGFHNFVDIHYF